MSRKKIESNLGMKRTRLGVVPAWQPVAIRAYTIPLGAAVVGKTVHQAEHSVQGTRIFAERIRRNGEVFEQRRPPCCRQATGLHF